MGMAAGQARFLGLTARKTNVEFQGQQINQQRTTLSNQTSSLNSSLLNLKVPTPPSVSDYTKTSYSWTQGNQENTITGVRANYDTVGGVQVANGTYSVDYTTPIEEQQGALAGKKSIYKSTAGNYVANDVILSKVITDPDDPDYDSTDVTNVQLIKGDIPAVASETEFYKYVNKTTNETSYLSKTEMDAAITASTTVQSYKAEDVTIQETGTLTSAIIAWDGGRMSSIVLDSTQDANSEILLNVNNNKDEIAYDDAMNKYEYDKAEYEKALNDINAKIEIVQQQDKSLELKLKECDTEQKAISTELDAVKKVIDKNVESSFKTFG